MLQVSSKRCLFEDLCLLSPNCTLVLRSETNVANQYGQFVVARSIPFATALANVLLPLTLVVRQDSGLVHRICQRRSPFRLTRSGDSLLNDSSSVVVALWVQPKCSRSSRSILCRQLFFEALLFDGCADIQNFSSHLLQLFVNGFLPVWVPMISLSVDGWTKNLRDELLGH